MAIYCNTLEGNMQYGDDPYCFTPRTLCCKYESFHTLLLQFMKLRNSFLPQNFSHVRIVFYLV